MFSKEDSAFEISGFKFDLIGSINDFRHVSHEELLSFGNGFDNFTDPGVTHFSEILFDFIHHQVCLLCMPCINYYGFD